jgi:hypothetical protein
MAAKAMARLRDGVKAIGLRSCIRREFFSLMLDSRASLVFNPFFISLYIYQHFQKKSSVLQKKIKFFLEGGWRLHCEKNGRKALKRAENDD